jgi:hypothetical protein
MMDIKFIKCIVIFLVLHVELSAQTLDWIISNFNSHIETNSSISYYRGEVEYFIRVSNDDSERELAEKILDLHELLTNVEGSSMRLCDYEEVDKHLHVFNISYNSIEDISYLYHSASNTYVVINTSRSNIYRINRKLNIEKSEFVPEINTYMITEKGYKVLGFGIGCYDIVSLPKVNKNDYKSITYEMVDTIPVPPYFHMCECYK